MVAQRPEHGVATRSGIQRFVPSDLRKLSYGDVAKRVLRMDESSLTNYSSLKATLTDISGLPCSTSESTSKLAAEWLRASMNEGDVYSVTTESDEAERFRYRAEHYFDFISLSNLLQVFYVCTCASSYMLTFVHVIASVYVYTLFVHAVFCLGIWTFFRVSCCSLLVTHCLLGRGLYLWSWLAAETRKKILISMSGLQAANHA